MHKHSWILTSLSLIGASLLGCSANNASTPEGNVGDVEVALTNTPIDVSCLRITVTGARSDVRSFPLVPRQAAVFKLSGLPVGNASISAGAFAVSCANVTSGVEPTWFSEPQTIRVGTGAVTHVALLMIHNGQISVGVDFDDSHGPSTPDAPAPTGGVHSSQRPYLVPVAAGVQVRAILTVGDSANNKPDGSPYRMVGLPDGLGAFDKGDGTFTLLSNHELPATAGIPRAHGARGAFVSKWSIRKSDLAVLSGADLIQSVTTWNPATSSYAAPATGTAFGRFCSADLAAPSAFFDVASGLGFDGRLFFDGEETGAEGRAFAHGLDGVSWELPRLGKFSWENSVANPGAGAKTVVAGTDDSGGGQIYFYVGKKTAAGSPVERAGLTNGTLFGLRVVDHPVEDPATGMPTSPFELFDLGNVENTSGASLETASNTNLVSKFQRPEDASWDPNNPNDLYFVTTASFTTSSRLWRARFADIRHPERGGRFEMLLDGSEGQHMFDNITLDPVGHVYLQEDIGGNDALGKVWRYDIATDTLTHIASHSAEFFDPTIASPTFITNDEESSGIIDASDILGPGWLLLDVQSHAPSADPELVEGGQFLALFDPAGVP